MPGEDFLTTVDAVVETLGERIFKKHRKHLAAQLPKELKPIVLRHPVTNLLSLEMFYRYVAARAGLSFHDSIRHSKTVISVLREAIAEGEFRDIFAELPPEFAELFGQKPARISPTTVDTHELY